MKVAFYTLGCKVNQGETASLEAMFTAEGYQVAPPEEAADVFVVNSCTVTAAGEAKSRRRLQRARRENPNATLVLTGCWPQAFPNAALATVADVVTGTARRASLLDNIRRFHQTGHRVVDIPGYDGAMDFEELEAGLLPGRTRAFLKIQDGCDGKCAYCIVPTARGPVRSRPLPAILAEAQRLAAAGCTEVVLTGINLPSYGRDTGGDLADAVDTVAGVEGISRVRLSSLDPHRVTPAQVQRFAGCGKLCRHFHLSLQSGSSATLARMRRPYTAAQYAAAAQALRAAMPDATFTTDVIVGFPGETAAEFEESLAFVQAMGFLKVHVFPFSARPGTPAAAFADQVPKAEKAARALRMQLAADTVRRQLLAAEAGKTHQVLLETPAPDGHFTGYTMGYHPVVVDAPGATQGDHLAVQVARHDADRDLLVCRAPVMAECAAGTA